MSEKKRHHYVPQFLLRRFAEGEGATAKLELIPRDDLRRVIPLSVEKSLAENYFYAIETPKGRDNFVEDLLAEHVEDPAAVAMRRILDEGRPLSAPAWRAPLALFLSFQRSRGPAMRQMLADHLMETARKMISISTPAMVRDVLSRKREEADGDGIAADLDFDDDDDETTEAANAETTEAEAKEIIAFARLGNYELAVQRVANLHADSLLKGAIEMVPYFDKRVWCVLEFDDPVLFTCDEPVALVGDDARAPGDACGLARARAIVFPTDPHRALVLLAPWVEAFEGRHRGGPRDAEVINQHVAFNAHRFLARRPGVPSLKGLMIPKKAPSVFVLGNLIGMQPHASEASRAKAIQRMKARGRGRRPR